MAVPKWLKKATPQEMGRRYEKKVAKKVGGRVQAASGALPQFKEDVETEDYLIQVKQTGKRQFILKLDDLETLRENALKRGKTPLFTLQMGGRSWWIREAR